MCKPPRNVFPPGLMELKVLSVWLKLIHLSFVNYLQFVSKFLSISIMKFCKKKVSQITNDYLYLLSGLKLIFINVFRQLKQKKKKSPT